MSKISTSILKGLSTLVPDQLNYICLVEYNDKIWYLALGQKSFYFISADLNMYKDPAIPYSAIEACRLCAKRSTLMQIKLFPQMSGDKNDPLVKLDMDLSTTYRDRKLNIYTQDRKAAVDSFKCYW